MLQRAAGRAEQQLGLSWSQTDQRGRRRLRSPLLDLWLQDAAGSEKLRRSLVPHVQWSGSRGPPRRIPVD